jgi:hypothetical protein
MAEDTIVAARIGDVRRSATAKAAAHEPRIEQLRALLDVDSALTAAFAEIDRMYLDKVVALWRDKLPCHVGWSTSAAC